MKPMGKKLIIVSFILALLSAVSAFAYLQSLKTSKEPNNMISILVATEAIPARTLITNNMVKQLQVIKDPIFTDYISDTAKIIGKYTKDTILSNEGFRESNLLSSADKDLTLGLESNFRAVSINVTGDSAVSNLIKVGDFVDVVAFLPEKKELEKTVRPEVAKIVFQNIQVLAVDQQLDRIDTTKTKATTEKIPTTFLVTLAIPFSGVEKITLTENIGSIKLALRPLSKEENKDTKGATWQDIIPSVSVDGSTTPTQTPTADNNKPSTSTSNTNKDVNYTIKPGDTLRTISFAFYGDAGKYMIIKQANNIVDENQILSGTIIRIPAN